MTLTGKWVRKKILITVKAYPQPSQTYGEAVCTAGITEDGNWIRLYPVRFRDLPFHNRFKKYQWIEASICKSTSDSRPESFRIDHDTIKILDFVDTKDGWKKRKEIVMPLLNKSLEELTELRRKNEISLGFIKPKQILELVIEPVERNWSEKQQMSLINNQISIFDINDEKDRRGYSEYKKLGLEKIPYKFMYHFYCDDESCKGHKIQILDWEISQSYRCWGQTEQDKIEMIKNKYLTEFITKKDIYFYMGTLKDLHRFDVFSIIGIFYPPKCSE